jgi:ribosomal protein S18 acetylase RimI-like enzyme
MACSGLIRLHRAVPVDAAGIASVHVRTWQRAYRGLVPAEFLAGLSVDRRADWWRREIESTPPDRAPWVASDDSHVVGFVSVGPSRDDGAGPHVGELYAIYVDPDCWDRGVGRELLRHAERDLAAAGYDDATLWVLTANERGRRFYEAGGWVADGATQTASLGGADLEEVRYRLDFRRGLPKIEGGLWAGPVKSTPGRRKRDGPSPP